MDQWRRLVFQADGPEFRPGRMDLRLIESFEPNTAATFGEIRGQVVSFGSALYRVPDDLPRAEKDSQLEIALAHLADLLPEFRAAGATSFILHMHRTFQGHCTEEFTLKELRMLLSLDCYFFYVAQADWIFDDDKQFVQADAAP